MNIAKFLKTAFFIEHLRWLVLSLTRCMSLVFFLYLLKAPQNLLCSMGLAYTKLRNTSEHL